MLRQRERRRDDHGETLIELVVALAILGIAAVAILTGVMTSIRASTLHRNEATGGAYVRSFAEAIQNYVDANGFPGCGGADAAYEGVTVPDLPDGYDTDVVSIQSWTGTAWSACTGLGIQRVELTVTSTGDSVNQAVEDLVVVLRMPCNGNADTSASNPCA